MGLYERCILPRLLDLAMRNRVLDPCRRRAIAAAEGRVVEIGVGSGLNLPLYGAAVEQVWAIDPSRELLRLAARRRGAARVPVALVEAAAERLPLAAASCDTVVMTWTLCSVADPAAALAEMRRVLKPGGRLVFVEHGLAPEAGIARWQRRLTPYWKRLAGGCHLDRDIKGLIADAGFRLDDLGTGHLPGPKPWTFMYEGRAQP
jgi:ubiquinone/menaquinone biosynthesis C-methylase UbiE